MFSVSETTIRRSRRASVFEAMSKPTSSPVEHRDAVLQSTLGNRCRSSGMTVLISPCRIKSIFVFMPRDFALVSVERNPLFNSLKTRFQKPRDDDSVIWKATSRFARFAPRTEKFGLPLSRPVNAILRS